MNILKKLIVVFGLFLVLALSLLLVLLNTQVVALDFFGLMQIKQSIGVLVVSSFVVGILFCLSLIFIPSQFLQFRNQRLKKKLSS